MQLCITLITECYRSILGENSINLEHALECFSTLKVKLQFTIILTLIYHGKQYNSIVTTMKL